MTTEPLGDQAVLTRWDSEADAIAFSVGLRQAPPPWVVDIVPAYSSVAVFYDPERIDYKRAAAELTGVERSPSTERAGRHHVIPCCYELGVDLQRVADATGLSRDAVIELHAQTPYTVYAIGFCPGFPYLGYLPPALRGVPRLETPRVRVEAGSVGLTGRQTGIYTEARPGGWNIVGRTPCCLVDVADGYFPLRTGDVVQFQRIDAGEYERRQGTRL